MWITRPTASPRPKSCAPNGTFTLLANGQWTFVASSAFNELNVGQQVQEVFTVTSLDGTPQNVTVTVTGTNDLSVISSASVDVIESNASLNTGGTLSISDVDGPAPSFNPVANASGNGGYGLFNIGSNGVWSYSTTGPLNQLVAGQTYTDTLTVTAADGSTGTITVTILGTNDAPVLGGVRTSFTYSESAASGITRTLLDSSVTLTDIDSSNFDGGSVVVSISNVEATQDQLTVQNQGTASGQISVVGSDVRYNFGSGAVSIGTISGGTAGIPLTISLNSNATPVAVDALVQRIAYGNSSQLPNTTPRTISITVNDGDGTANGGSSSVTQNITMNVTSVNDAPTFSSLGGAQRFTEGGSAVVLDNNASLGDRELAVLGDFGGASLTLSRRGGANSDDDFRGTGSLSLSAGKVSLSGALVGSYDQAALTNGTLQITFNSGTSNAQANSVLRQIAYSNGSDAPPASVVIDYVLNDNNGGAQGTGGAKTATGSVTVNITAVNDAPTINVVAQALTENTAVAGSVAATYTTGDEEAGSLTVSFAAGSNDDGYYALANGRVELTQAGADHVNAGNSLPPVNLVVTDAGALTGTDSDTPSVTLANDAPTINVVAQALTENAAVAGSVAATYTTGDEEAGSLTVSFAAGSNDDGYYALANGRVELTQAGADHVNAGNSLPPVNLVVTDAGALTGTDSDTPSVTLANDAPTINVVAQALTENAAVAGSVAATYTTGDEEAGSLTVSFAAGSNDDGYYALANGRVELTQAGADHVNAGNSLPPVNLVVTDAGALTGTDSDTPSVTLANDAPTINVVAQALTENTAVAGSVAATYTTGDEEAGSLTVSFAAGSNDDGYYALANGRVELTQAGADHVNAGNSLPPVNLVVTDAGALTGTDSDTPSVTLANDAPTINVVAQALTENAAVAGSVAATYTTGDEEAGSLTVSFAAGSNDDGYYALANGRVELTQAGADHVNAGNSLPPVNLVVTDAGALTGTDSDTPSVTLANDAPTINVVAQALTENAAVAGSVAATYTTGDEEAGSLTVSFAAGSNDDGYYALANGRVELTQAGADHVNAGNSLPPVNLVVTDAGALTDTDSDTPSVTLANDAPTINVVAQALTENAAVAGSVAATYTTGDEEAGSLTVSFAAGSNDDGYYALANGRVELTQAGADHVNAGNSLPPVNLVVTDAGALTGTDSDTPSVTLANDAPTINVVAQALTENAAVAGSVAATYTTGDEEAGSLTVSFAAGSNDDGYYALANGRVELTQAGADHVNAGNSLPPVNLVVTDAGALTGTDSDTPSVTLANDAPTINVVAQALTENTAVAGSVAATYTTGDEEAGSLTVSFAAGSNDDGYYALANGRVELTQAGADHVNAGNSLPPVNLVVTDAGALTGTDSDTPSVTLANDAPTINVVAQALTENAAVAGSVAATYTTGDEEAGSLTVSFAAGSNDDGYYALANGRVELTQAGADHVNAGNSLPPVNLVVTDAGALTGTDSDTPSVTLANDAPTINVVAQALTENTAVAGSVAATYTTGDEEAGSLTVSFAAGSNDDGYYALANGRVELTQAGADHVNAGNSLPPVNLVVTDAGALTDTDSDTPSVTLANDAPTINVVAQALTENAAVAGSVAATYTTGDEEAGSLTVSFAAGSNDDGYYALANGRVELTQAGADHVNAGNSLPPVNLVVTDAGALTGTDSDTPSVTLANDAPTINVVAQALTENAAVAGSVAATYTTGDEEAGSLTVSFAAGSNDDGYYALANGRVELTQAGADHVNAGNSLPPVNLVVTDAGALTGTDSDTPSVTLANDAPTINVVAQALTENTAVAGSVAATYTTGDEEAGSLTVSFAAGSNDDGYYALANGRVELTQAGADHVNAGNSLPPVNLVVTDAGALTGTDSDTPSVTLANDAPTINVVAQALTENTAVAGSVAATYTTGDEEAGSLTVSFAAGSNDDGYYALANGRVELTQAGADHVNAGNSLPPVNLVVTDAGALTGTDSDTPSVTLANDAPTINVVAQALTENAAVAGSVAATYTTGDEEAGSLTVSFAAGSNDDGYYALANGRVELTQAGADHVNAGNSLPPVNLVVTDAGALTGTDSDTPSVTLANDAPTINVVAQALTENAAVAGSVAATYTTGDEEAGSLTVSFAAGSNDDGYYALANGRVELTQAGADHVNAGNSLPPVNLVVTDAGALTGTDSDTPSVTLANDAPTINVVAQALTENTAVAGSVAATYTTGDEEAGSLTVSFAAGSNDDGYYALANGRVELTQAGADHVNAGNSLPPVNLVVTDAGALTGTDSDTPSVTLANDAPTINVVAQALTENAAVAGSVAATYTTGDEEAGSLTVSFAAGSNDDGYYALANGRVELTQAGADHVNAGNSLPPVNLVVTDAGALTGTDSDTPSVTLANDAPTINVVAQALTENAAVAGSVAATYTTGDEEAGSLTVSFAAGSNDDGYYALANGRVELTQAGADHVNAGNSLPPVNLVVTDAGALTGTDSDTPSVTLANDAPTINVVAQALTENTAVAGSVAATYTTGDEEAGSLTVSFAAGSNDDGYYALANGRVELTQAGADHVNAGNSLPPVNLVVTDAGALTGTDSDTPSVTLANDAPTINVVAQALTENAAVAGSVAATYTTGDEEAGSLTVSFAAGSNDDGYYALANGRVELTQAGADHVNAGNSLPPVNLVVTDAGALTGTDSDTPSVTLANDAPTINVVAQALTENAAVAGSVAATYTTGDEEAGSLTVSFAAGSNDDGYYALANGRVELTQAGADHVNAGNSLPPVNLVVTDAGALTDTDSDTPSVTLANDAPTINVVAQALTENTAVAGSVAATYTTGDEEAGSLTVSFAAGSNDDGYYALANGRVELTQAGADHVNAGNSLPPVNLVVTDAGALTGTDSDTPSVTLANDAPTINVVAQALTENAAVAGSVAATYTTGDEEAGSLTVSFAAGSNDDGYYALANGRVELTQAGADHVNAGNSLPPVNLVVTDAGALTGTDSDTPSVTLANDAPTINVVAQALTENAAVAGSVAATYTTGDEEAGSLTVSFAAGSNDDGYYALANGRVELTQAGADHVNAGNSLPPVNLVVTDAGALTGTDSDTPSVTLANDAPTINVVAQALTENTAVAGSVAATYTTGDEEAGSLTVSFAAGSNDDGYYALANGRVELTQAGADHVNAGNSLPPVNLVVTDAGALTGTDSDTPSVTLANDAPTINVVAQALTENTAVAGSVAATYTTGDEEAGSLTVSFAAGSNDDGYYALANGRVELTQAGADHVNAGNSLPPVNLVVTDAGALTGTDSDTPSVTLANDAPTINVVAQALTENAAVAGSVAATYTTGDEEAGSLTVSFAAGSNDDGYYALANGRVELTQAGADHVNAGNSLPPVNLVVTDAGALTGTDSDTPSVTLANDAPTINVVAQALTENAAVAGSVAATYTTGDEEAGSLTVSFAAGSNDDGYYALANGRVELTQAGADHVNAGNSLPPVNLVVTDAGALTGTDSDTPSVTLANDAPTINVVAQALTENTAVAGSVAATYTTGDEEAGSLTVSFAAGSNDDGYYALANGRVELTQAGADHVNAGNSLPPVNLVVTDAGALTGTDSDTPSVTLANDAPTINVVAQALTENAAVAGSVAATYTTGDEEAGSLTVSFAAGSNDDGYYALANGRVELTQAGADHVNAGNSLPPVNLVVTDAGALTGTDSDTPSVTLANDAPTINVVAQALTENAAVAGSVAATYTTGDEEAGSLTVSFAAGSNDDGYYALANGRVELTQAGADHVNAGNSLPPVNLVVTDAGALTGTDSDTPSVTLANDAPTINVVAQALTENTAVAGSVAATYTTGDEEAGSLTVSFAAGSNDDGYYALANGRVELTQAGADHVNAGNSLPPVNLVVTDAGALTGTDSDTPSVTLANDAPTINVVAQALTENAAVAGSVAATYTTGDEEAGSLTVSFAAGSNDDGYYALANGRVELTQAGADHVNAGNSLPPVNLVVTDAGALTGTDSDTPSVTLANDAPTINVVAQALTENAAVAGSVAATYTTGDEEAGSLTVSFAAGSNDDGYYALANGRVELTQAGADHVNAGNSLPPVNLVVTDAGALTGTDSDTPSVTLANDAPTINVVAQALTENAAVAGSVAATYTTGDEEAGSLTVSFAAGSNDDGYYALANGRVELTQAGADHVNAGNSLPPVNLVVTDAGALTGTDSDTPSVTLANDAPTINVVAQALTENTAVAGSVAATYTTGDEEAGSLTVSFAAGSNDDGYYALANGRVELTQAGADHVNAGNSLPPVNLVVTDAGALTGTDSDTPSVTLANDAPTINVVAQALTENAAVAGSVAATYTTGDEEAGSLTVSFAAGSNDDGYYALANGRVELTQAGADHVNAGNSLPPVNLVVTDAGALTGTDSDTPSVTLANDAPTINVVAQALTENTAVAGSVAATYTTGDEEAGSLTVSFAAGSNDDGYYALANGRVELTQAGADHVNAGNSLPPVNLVVTDAGALTGTDSDTPSVTLANDAPTINVVAQALTENTAVAGSVAATYTTGDEEAGSLTVSFAAGSNDDGYYALANGRVELTQAGADHVNAGNSLPPVNLVVTDAGALTGTDSDTPSVTLANDAPTINVVAQALTENAAVAGSVAATYTTGDEEAGSLTVSFAAGSNDDGYYALANGRVELTQAGADHVNAGNSLPTGQPGGHRCRCPHRHRQRHAERHPGQRCADHQRRRAGPDREHRRRRQRRRHLHHRR